MAVAAAMLACAQAFRAPRAPAGRAPALRVASAMEQQQALTLGAPRFCPPNGTYVTAGGVGVTRTSQVLPREIVDETVEALVDDLDERRGVLLASSYEFRPLRGLYGALGYDLMFQFEPIEPTLERDAAQRDVVLYVPDEILVVDRRENAAWRVNYDFSWTVAGASKILETKDLPRGGEAKPYGSGTPAQDRDVEPGGFAKLTERAKEEFARQPRGRVPRRRVAEMFVRVERVDGRLRVETCPISGTIERGADALEDALQVRALLGSKKDESELTMCTDVDRNDKSRICEQGSVEVIGRRQIEMYSKLIHTVDHAWAARFIETHERSARAWYGGAVGHVAFDGSLNTGLTLRTIHIADGVASVRAGATLLYDSDADAEEAETELKASAMINVLRDAGATGASGEAYKPPPAVAALGDGDAFDATTAGAGKRVLLVDHEDSFVHTLANYLRQTGADVQVSRFGAAALAAIDGAAWDLVVLSPGPGRPRTSTSKTLDACAATATPVFGVCLGLQGIVEHLGGTPGTLPVPVHGKPAQVLSSGGRWKSFDGLPPQFDVARYHSLYADDFHPESTNPRHGLRMLANRAGTSPTTRATPRASDVAMALD
ncbi:anthranilate synthase [Aureococcus anophagefferens]|nr:anthranilate synthase [Aureococcus anophagefferens]